MLPVQLGKLPAKEDSRNLKLAAYLPTLPEIPESAGWHACKPCSDWGMYGNDKYGNCVVVTAAHIIDCAQVWEFGNGKPLGEDRVVYLSNLMDALHGYYILDRLKYWRNFGMFDTKIEAFVDVDKNHDYIRSAINIFGHADIGLLMPRAWQNTNFWDAHTSPEYDVNTWGGHSVPLLGYAKDENYGLIYYACTWGHIVEVTASAIERYCDEIYTSILPDWYAKDGITASGFNIDQLREDLAKL